jgi:hypothetical protein
MALEGETEDTLIAGIVMVADVALVVSVTEVAVTATVRSLAGGVVGAV